jgi:Chaperone of endosialidase/Stigma-specific protein, Stig1
VHDLLGPPGEQSACRRSKRRASDSRGGISAQRQQNPEGADHRRKDSSGLASARLLLFDGVMTSTNRPILLLWLAVFALSCGSVTSLSTDAATDKGGTAGGGGGAGGTTGTAGQGGAGTGTSGHAGAGGSTGTAGAGGPGGTSGQGGAGGSGACSVACARGRMCCGGACANLDNDPMNCGTCGMRCEGASNLCSGGTCVPPPCSAAAGVCAANSFCCGGGCCLPGQLCCQADGPLSGGAPTCFTPTSDQKTCAQGCAPLCVSDRNQKKNIAPVDAAAILDKVSRLPISSWTYDKEPADVRHLGPMAQDFRAAFGLGDDEHTYYSVDAQGVALAAIKALNEQLTAQEARIEKLERENQSLARRLREVGRNLR